MAMPGNASAIATPTAADVAAGSRSVDPTGSDEAAAVAKAPNAPFFLRHHPSNWDAEDVDGVTTWLPHIGIFPLVPGAHLVRTRKQGEALHETFRNAKNTDENAGWIHLSHSQAVPAGCLPEGVGSGGYLRGLDCKDPRSSTTGTYHTEAWNVARAPVKGRPQRFAFDRASYNRWRLWLVTSGIVPPPAPDVIAEMVAAKSGRPARIASVPRPEDLRTKLVSEAEKVVADMAGAKVPGVKVVEAESKSPAKPGAPARNVVPS